MSRKPIGQLDVGASPSLQQAFSHGQEVHGVLDDAAVAWHQAGVDGLKEGPGVAMSFHLHQDDPGQGTTNQTQHIKALIAELVAVWRSGRPLGTYSQKVRSGWLRVIMRRRLLLLLLLPLAPPPPPPSPDVREDEGVVSLCRVVMPPLPPPPPLRRTVVAASSSELSSSYLLFFTRLLVVDERSGPQSVCWEARESEAACFPQPRQAVTKGGWGTDLGHAVWTKPVSLRHLREFGPQAVHVAAAVAAVAQQ